MPEPLEETSEFSINDVLDTLRRRKWVIIQAFVFVTIVGAVTASLSPSTYHSTARLLVTTPANSGVIIQATSGRGGDDAFSSLNWMRTIQSVDTQLAIMRSSIFQQGVAAKAAGAEGSAGASLSFSAQENTPIISINADSADPKAAAKWANTAADEYVELTDQSNKEVGLRYHQQLIELRDKSKHELDRAEQTLKAFRSKNQVLPEEDKGSDERERDTNEAETKERDLQSQLVALTARIEGTSQQLLHEPETIEEVHTEVNPQVTATEHEIASLEEQLAVLRATHPDTSAEVIDLNAQIEILQQALPGLPGTTKHKLDPPNPQIPKLKGDLAGMQLERVTLTKELEIYAKAATGKRESLVRQGPNMVDDHRLEREVTDLEKTWEDASSKLMNVDLQLANIPATAHVLETASVPMSAVGPQRTQQLSLAMLMGILIGVGVAFLQEFLDDRVNTSEDIARVASLATLGVVPTIPDENNRLLIGQDAFSPITESYRALRTAVQYSYVDHKVNALAVTSAHPGEGKSVTSANLGIAMALQGKRVILVDADLRRPSIHRMFRIEAEPGLTSVLAGEVSLEDALHSTAIEGFHVMTTGPLPPNPPELLNSQAMMDLLEEFKKHADLVIFDTPPTIPVTDAQVLAPHVDGVVLVVEAGQSRKATLKHARDLLERTHGRLLGVVLNKIDQSSKGYYYHYYYRGGYRKYRKYGYGKRYGYGGYGYGGYGGYGGGYGGYGGYGYGSYGYGGYGGYGGNKGYGYGSSRHKLGGSEEDTSPRVEPIEEAEKQARLPDRLRDWE